MLTDERFSTEGLLRKLNDMKIIDTILKSKYFLEQPPVLIDIGASGEINVKWKQIAPYSICIAFDADDRDFRYNENDGSGYKKLITINRIVTSGSEGKTDFYLTSSPYCSSLLKPDMHKLKPWIFSALFEVKKVTQLSTISLTKALEQAGVNYIDWFKSDTQGTDLRLFKSLPSSVISQILAAEFEPGIMDAYEGEDKLYMVMKEMHERAFWLSSMQVKGTQRLSYSYAETSGSLFRNRLIRKSPCWAELTYLKQNLPQSERDVLLLCVFALLEKQYGFVLEVLDLAMDQFRNPIFESVKKAVMKKLGNEKFKVPLVVLKSKINNFFSNIHD
jgi:hypothetical protein